jgi:hypothetical protein
MVYNMINDTPFREGFRAFHAGYRITHNPYIGKDEVCKKLWDEGFEAGARAFWS